MRGLAEGKGKRAMILTEIRRQDDPADVLKRNESSGNW